MTLDERAMAWAEKKLQDHKDWKLMSERVKEVWLDGYKQDYIEIALEQKAIDAKREVERISDSN